MLKFSKLMEKDKRKVTKLVEGRNFDLLIMSLICMDAIALGLIAAVPLNTLLSNTLFVLDRLFMAIFIVEMLMKIYVYGRKFFKSGWNVFDLTVVAVSSVSMFGFFIILRAFRLFRLLKYISKFSRLKKIINTFLMLLPNFTAILLVFVIFFYIFGIIAVFLYGDVFLEFSTLGSSLFTLLQVFTLDGWAENIARPMMTVYPNSWVFFVSFLFLSFLIVVSFLLNVILEIVETANGAKKIKSRL